MIALLAISFISDSRRCIAIGTTVTPNISLIKPDLAESIKADLPTFQGWAVQNGSNCDTLDSLFRANNNTYTLNWTGAGGNPTLGTGGFTEGKWLRLWPRVCITYFRVSAGAAGFAAGAGVYRFNLPFAPDIAFSSFNLMTPIGRASLLDNDAIVNCSSLICVWDKASSSMILRSPGGNFFSPTNPITVAQGDRFCGYAMFPTSAL